MKKILLIFSALLFLVPSISNSATVYVNNNCSNGISTYNPATQSCTGGSATVYSTVTNGIAASSATDVVSIGDGTGTYPESMPLTIPVEISLTSTSQDASAVKITPGSNYTAGPMIVLSSTTPGTSGNQSITYLSFDGIDTYTARFGMYVQNRDDVTIQHNIFTDFNSYIGASQGAGSYGFYAMSNDLSPTNNWDSLVDPPLVQETSWSGATKVSGLDLSYNDFTTCGVGNTSRIFTPAIKVWLLDTFVISYNDVNVSHTTTEGLFSTAAALSNGSIHHNTFTCYSTGRFAYGLSLYAFEIWALWNVDIYNNICTNGHFSLTAGGGGTKIHGNVVDVSGATLPVGTALEVIVLDGDVYDNFLRGNPNAGQTYGITAGLSINQDSASYEVTTRIWNNIIIDMPLNAIRMEGDEDRGTYYPKSHIKFINNIVDNNSNVSYHYPAIRINEGGNTTIDVEIKNNIITNNYTGIQGIDLEAGDADIDTNIFNGNTTDYTGSNISPQNTITTAPTFTDYANRDFSIGSAVAAQVDAGLNLNLPYTLGLSASTDFTSDPVSIVEGDQLSNGDGVDIGPYFYADAADVTGPVVSSVTPNSELSAGTTSTGFSATSNDAAGTTAGVKWDTSDVLYASMANTASGSGDGTYTDTITGLTDDTRYHYYGAAIDDSDNITYFDIIFSVAPAATNYSCDDADTCHSTTGTGWNVYPRIEAINGTHHASNTNGDTSTFTLSNIPAGDYLIQAHIFDGGHDTAAATVINDVYGPTSTTFNMVGADAGEWSTITSTAHPDGIYRLSGTVTVVFTVGSAWIIADDVRLVPQTPAQSLGGLGGGGVSYGGP